MIRRWPDAMFVALTLACFAPFLFTGKTLYDVRTLEALRGAPSRVEPGWFERNRPPMDRGDTVLSLAPLHRIYGDGLRAGELRLWNPHLFGGCPLYNNLGVHPFYPPNLAAFALLPPRLAYDLVLLLHFLGSGLAMTALLRGLGRSTPAAAAGALLWSMGGAAAFWFSTGNFMGASVFAPLALLGLVRAREAGRVAPAAAGGLSMGLVILGSHGQHAMIILTVLVAWIAVEAVRDRAARPFLLRAGATFVAVALGAGLAAILTQLDSVLNGFRKPGGDLDLIYGDPWRVPTYLAGLAVGKLVHAPDGLLRSEFTVSCGLAGTALVVAGTVRGLREPHVRFFAIFGAFALLVAFLRPLAQAVLLVPLLNLSMPSRWIFAFGLCAPILAARGWDALAREPGRLPKVLAALAAAAMIAALGVRGIDGAFIETLGAAATLVAAALALPRSPRLAGTLAITALLVDLGPDFACFNRHADPAPLDALRPEPPPEDGPWRSVGTPRGPATVWTLAIGSNLLSLTGHESIVGYESIAPRPALRFAVEAGGLIAGSGRVVALATLDSPLLSAANVRTAWWPPDLPPPAGWWPAGPGRYENPRAAPRAFFPSTVLEARDDDEAARLLGSPRFDPRSTAVVEGAAPASSGIVRWKERSTDRTVLEATATAPGLLFVADADYPGWEAEIDGAPVPILRADLMFRGVVVPAGTHTVTFRFRPVSARNGSIGSGLTIVAVSAGLALNAWRRRRTADILPT